MGAARFFHENCGVTEESRVTSLPVRDTAAPPLGLTWPP